MNQKETLGPQTLLLTNPVVLVGSVINGEPSFTAISWAGMVNSDPPMLSVSIRPGRHICQGIQAHGTFSVNIPSTSMVAEADYCGTVSGSRTNKIKDCGFTVFQGTTPQAPLIAEAPVNIECQVHSVQNLGTHNLVIGRIMEIHVSKDCLVDGKPSPDLIQPFSYASACQKKEYRTLGPVIAPAYSVKNPPRST